MLNLPLPDVITTLIAEQLSLEDMIRFTMLSNDDLVTQGPKSLTLEEAGYFRKALTAALDEAVSQLIMAGYPMAIVPGESSAITLLGIINGLYREQQALSATVTDIQIGIQQEITDIDDTFRLNTIQEKFAIVEGKFSPHAFHSVNDIITVNRLLDEVNSAFADNELPETKGTHVCLYRCHLTRIPEALITRLQAYHYLKSIDLSRNSLTILPESLATLTTLQELILDHNQLSALPEFLYNNMRIVVSAENNPLPENIIAAINPLNMPMSLHERFIAYAFAGYTPPPLSVPSISNIASTPIYPVVVYTPPAAPIVNTFDPAAERKNKRKVMDQEQRQAENNDVSDDNTKRRKSDRLG